MLTYALLGNQGCMQLPGKITCPETLGGDAQRKEAPCSREAGECYPRETGPPPNMPEVPSLGPRREREKLKSRLGWSHLPFGGDGYPSSADSEAWARTCNTDTLLHVWNEEQWSWAQPSYLHLQILLGESSVRRPQGVSTEDRSCSHIASSPCLFHKDKYIANRTQLHRFAFEL